MGCAEHQHRHSKSPNKTGKGYNLSAFNASIQNGKVSISGRTISTGTFDFVITNDGKLIVGTGHHYMSGGAETVKAAGQMKLINGDVRSITNSSGHYLPTVEQGAEAFKLLNEMGVNTSKTKLILLNQDGRPVKSNINQ